MNVTQKILEVTQTNLSVEIKSFADVSIDDYNEGEGAHVNHFENDTKRFSSTEATLKDDILSNLKKYVRDVIYTDYNEESIKEQLAYRDDAIFFVSVLVDNNNTEPSKTQLENWKNGIETLYIQDNCISISVNGTVIACELLNELLFDTVAA